MRRGDVSVRVSIPERDLFVIDAALRYYADTIYDPGEGDMDPNDDRIDWIEAARAARGRLIRARHRKGLYFHDDQLD